MNTVGKLLLCWLLLAAPVPVLANGTGGGAIALQQRVISLLEKHAQSVVRVKAAHRQIDKAGEQRNQLRYSTGFFISGRGHVLTVASAAFQAESVWVVHEGVDYDCEVVGHDLDTNITLLRVLDPPENQSFLQPDSMTELPAVGTLALRISSPLEFEPSPYLGMVTGRESNYAQSVFPCVYVRTNLPGGPGEGGSPLLDLNGNLIGFMVASIGEMQASYALPAAAIARVRDDLVFTGEVKRAWVGFQIAPRDTENGRRIVLSEITPEGPADEAGLREGDILQSVGSFEIRSVDDVRNSLFYARVDRRLTVVVRRGDEELALEVLVAERQDNNSIFATVPKEVTEDVGQADASEAQADDRAKLEFEDISVEGTAPEADDAPPAKE